MHILIEGVIGLRLGGPNRHVVFPPLGVLIKDAARGDEDRRMSTAQCPVVLVECQRRAFTPEAGLAEDAVGRFHTGMIGLLDHQQETHPQALHVTSHPYATGSMSDHYRLCSVSSSSSKSVIWRPASASKRELSERHGVSIGGASNSAPAFTRLSVADCVSATSEPTRILLLTSRPTSILSINRRCRGVADRQQRPRMC